MAVPRPELSAEFGQVPRRRPGRPDRPVCAARSVQSEGAGKAGREGRDRRADSEGSPPKARAAVAVRIRIPRNGAVSPPPAHVLPDVCHPPPCICPPTRPLSALQPGGRQPRQPGQGATPNLPLRTASFRRQCTLLPDYPTLAVTTPSRSAIATAWCERREARSDLRRRPVCRLRLQVGSQNIFWAFASAESLKHTRKLEHLNKELERMQTDSVRPAVAAITRFPSRRRRCRALPLSLSLSLSLSLTLAHHPRAFPPAARPCPQRPARRSATEAVTHGGAVDRRALFGVLCGLWRHRSVAGLASGVPRR